MTLPDSSFWVILERLLTSIFGNMPFLGMRLQTGGVGCS